MLTALEQVLLNKNWRLVCEYLGLSQISDGLGDILLALTGEYAAPTADLAALRLVLAADRADKQIRLVEAEGALYRFDTTGTGADDGAGTIVPGDVTPPALGRWFKVQAAIQNHESLAGLLGGGANDHQHLTTAQLAGALADGLTSKTAGAALSLTSKAAASGTAVGVVIDTPASYAAGDKIASIRMGTAEKAYFDYLGDLVAPKFIGNVDGAAATTLILTGKMVDGGSAIGTIINSPAYANAGAKLLSIQNNSVEKAYVDKDGGLGIGYNAPLKIFPQEVTPATLTGAQSATAGVVDVGAHSYRIVFVTPEGDSPAGVKSGVVTSTDSLHKVDLTAIPIGSSRCTGRKVFRTLVGGNPDVLANYHLVDTIANTGTTYADNATDASIAAAASPVATNATSNVYYGNADATSYGHTFDCPTGSARIADFKCNGTTQAYISNIGDGSFSNALFVSNGIQLGWGTGGANINSVDTTHPLSISGAMADGATAIGVKINNSTALTTSGAKIASFQNNGVEKAFIDRNGAFSTLRLSALDSVFGSLGTSVGVALTTGDSSFSYAALTMYVITCTVDAWLTTTLAAATTDGTSCLILANQPRTITLGATSGTAHFTLTSGTGVAYITQLVPVSLP